MDKVIDPSKCPICGEPNQCAQEVAKSTGKPQEPCWCMTATFSSELLAVYQKRLKIRLAFAQSALTS
jgi:hypothetical protein